MSELVIRVGVDTGRSQAGGLRAERWFRVVGILYLGSTWETEEVLRADDNLISLQQEVFRRREMGRCLLVMAAAAITGP